MANDNENRVTILHFNDVYNIETRDKEPAGGAARFATAIRQRKHLEPMLVFSGDAFNPSIMSSFFKGRQMVAVLNALGVDIAVYGNHDFDFGVDKVVKLAGETTFPWLLSNVVDNFTEEPLAQGKPTHLMEWCGKSIGFVGLVESEWIDTLSTIDPDDITYLDFVEVGTKLAAELREEGADYVIALTHMRWPNDLKLAQEVDGIDLILGGHDHDFNVKEVNGKYVIKSGTDFQYVGQITIEFKDDGKIDVNVEKIVIDSTFDEAEDVKEIVSHFSDQLDSKMDKSLGSIEVDLEGRFSHVRTEETNLGNFIADIMLNSTKADAVLLNGGTLRSDKTHHKGEFKMKDMMSILPFGGCAVVLEVTGKQLHEALELGVSKYPTHEGRFPQVAGMSFGFNPDLPAMERVDAKYIKVQGEDLDLQKKYKLAVTDYVAKGRDGYALFEQCPQIISEDDGPVLHTIIQNHFLTIKVCKGEKQLKYGHHQAVLAVAKLKYLMKLKAMQQQQKQADQNANDESSNQSTQDETDSAPKIKGFGTLSKLVLNMKRAKKAALQRRAAREEAEREELPNIIAPKVEGRIFLLNEKK